ncbi:nucleotidyltransferase domain-containing protein [Thermococcus sp. AM4]|uniref:type VII toxin-antitoxin system MntA family adenylyltransferase antitoxin n=1 Tax=Thermococcus sp. (strain AM4) TaxID=246969 RepID=UPI00018711CA|nr:nucleotidyltransferase domain-containing protein [Thermococcus sp. AM4]EEB73691.1 Nucleotidyltransferase [Thermococcus sp. AM4]
MRVYSLNEREKREVIEILRELLLRRDEIIFAYLHGSFLEGPFRDIDVAVYVDSEVHPFYEAELEEDLSNALSLPVDVRILNEAPVTFRFRAIGGLLLFSRDEKIRCDFEERTMREYHDYSYYLNMYRREALGIR